MPPASRTNSAPWTTSSSDADRGTPGLHPSRLSGSRYRAGPSRDDGALVHRPRPVPRRTRRSTCARPRPPRSSPSSACTRRRYLDSVKAFSRPAAVPSPATRSPSAQSWDAALGAAGAVLAATSLALEKGTPRLRRGAPARPSRAARRGDGLLPGEQRGGRGARRAGRRARPGADHRLGRAPRQRHPGAGRTRCDASASSRCTSSPWYPGTGLATERGVGNVFNVPRGPGRPAGLVCRGPLGSDHCGREDWTPDIVFVSAGFDAMLGDPLGRVHPRTRSTTPNSRAGCASRCATSRSSVSWRAATFPPGSPRVPRHTAARPGL